MEHATKLDTYGRRHSATEDGANDAWMSEALEDSLIQRIARLEAALALTAGTVHDVNNVLTVLAGNLFLLTEDLRDQPKLFEQARRARNAAERGSTLLRELLTFSRETDAEPRAISPAEHVRSLEPLLKRTIGAEHALEIDIAPRTGCIDASAAQLESVLINLAINARDALEGRGTVRICVSDVELDARGAAALGIGPGGYVRIEVADDGCGIPARDLPRVTDPLFTTKPPERGSGLGLSMVKRFVARARGALDIASEEGHGTRVRLWLPKSERLAETTANMTLPLSTLPGGDEILLLATRDGEVRASLQQILESLGYTVLAARDLDEARRLLASRAPQPVLLVAERSSSESPDERRWLAACARERRLRHIALLEAGADPQGAAPGADATLWRPVNVLELAQTVRKVLES